MTSKGEILIVEDNHASLRLLAEILTDEGYVVRPADGGAIALASINAKRPDLILLDIQMEGVNGFEVLKNVKESPKSQDVPVIFLSATTNLEERVEGLRLGAVDFISKPYKKEELLARVAIQMQMRRLYAEIQQQKDQLAQTVEQLKAEIEERQRAEAALQRLNADLEQRVAQRTAHLEAANRELNAFTYSISHDLRVPLRAIAGFSHILNDEYHNILDGEGQRLLGVIRQNTVKLESLIDDILVLLRISQNKPLLSTTDMYRMVDTIYQQKATPEERAKINFDLQPLTPGYVDSLLIKMVWEQLLSNAIKFSSPREHPSIEVSSRVEKEVVVYCIKDNGVGFNPQYYHKLFGLFERLHKVGQFEGKGVGLAIVKRIVERHGGAVWAESTPDQGAAFYFSIPFVKEIL